MRSTVARTQEAMATEWAALNMEAWVKRRMRTFEDAERGLVFGRLTLDGTPRPLYVGRRWVHDEEHESLVVNWQAPAARPFYTATPQTPHGVQQRRRFRSEGRRLTDISDESLDGSAVEGASVSDFLLELLDGIEAVREEEPDVARLKGDPRLREVVARAVEIAVVPVPEELYTLVDGVYIRVRERDVAALLEEALAAGTPLGLARERFRM